MVKLHQYHLFSYCSLVYSIKCAVVLGLIFRCQSSACGIGLFLHFMVLIHVILVRHLFMIIWLESWWNKMKLTINISGVQILTVSSASSKLEGSSLHTIFIGIDCGKTHAICSLWHWVVEWVGSVPSTTCCSCLLRLSHICFL